MGFRLQMQIALGFAPDVSVSDEVLLSTARGYAELTRLRSAADAMAEALRNVMIGGNHLASSLIGWLGAGEERFPPYTATYDDARAQISDIAVYDAWVCWKTIMEAREALAAWERARGTECDRG